MADFGEQRDETIAPAKWRTLFWPGLIITLLVGQVVLLTIVVLIATRDESFAVEPDYYTKALNWDEQAAQLEANRRLGWSLKLSLGDAVGPIGDRSLLLHLRDATGDVIGGADVSVLAFPHARGMQRREYELPETQELGTYEAKVRFHRKGKWEFRFTVQRGENMFTHRLVRDVYPPGESRPWKP